MSDDGVLGVEDRLAIQDLYARYNFAIDSGDAPAFADVFIDEGVLQLPSFPVFEGREAITGFVKRRSGNPQRGISHSQHWNCNLLLESKADHVVGRVYLMLVAIGSATGEIRPVAHGYYTDMIVRRDGAWKFARRTVEVLGDAVADE